ncbi:MAG: NAD(P)-dependent oxidoreductase [Candidatus Omnitrophica bacterium]|nr:NAD(P)-dependent oxidoreductase [Candidatus Omnitrophota bacterium]
MKIAIFGASGRLGQEFCNFCLEKNLDFIAFVRSTQSRQKLSKICKSILLDEKEKFNKEIKEVSHVVNLTGSTNFRNFSELYQANVVATKNILESIKNFKNIKKFIHISSIAVYPYLEGKVIDETCNPNPYSYYGKTKLEAELEVLKFSKNFKVVILQPAIIYGPTFREGFYKVLQLIKEEKMPILGSGKNHIPLIFYSDVLQAIYLSLKKELKNPSKFILVKTPQLTQEQLFILAAKKLQAKQKFFYMPIFLAKFFVGLNLIKDINSEMIEQLTKDRIFDSTLAREVLGWKPKVSFEEGLDIVLESFFKK